ncbi:MAG: DUF6603 domain-containing protein [Blastocatellia bacterium]|nr:DUF6603 domain-containing protein [Blastocatellia bacterium]
MIFDAPDPFAELKTILPGVASEDGAGIELTFAPQTVRNFSVLFEKMAGEPIDTYLPQAFLDATEGVRLTGYSTFNQSDTTRGLSLAKTDAGGYRLAFALVWTKRIQIDDAIELDSPAVALEVTYSRERGVSVAGVISSGRLKFQELAFELDVAVQVPSMIVHANLGFGKDASAAAPADLAAKHLGESQQNGSEGVVIHDLRFMAAPRVKNYLLHLTVSNVLNLRDKIKLGDLQAEIGYRGGLEESNYSVRAYTDLEIGFDDHPLRLSLSGEFEKQGAGRRWRFSGVQSHPITVSQAMQDLANLFQEDGKPADNPYHLPRFIADTTLDHLGIEVKGGSGGALATTEYAFTLGLSIPVGERELRLEMYAQYAKSGAAYALTLTGSLLLDGFALGVAFSKATDGAKSDTTLLGSLQTPLKLDSTDLIRAIAPSLAEDVPIAVDIELLGLLLAMRAGGEKGEQARREYLFRLSFNLDVGLDGLPLIGRMLADVRFKDGQLLAANRDWRNERIADVNDLLGVIEPSPPSIAAPQQPDATVAVGKGITFSGTLQITRDIGFPLFLQFGGDKQQKQLPQPADEKQPATAVAAAPAGSTSAQAQSDARSQSKIDRVIGAVRIKKVALIFEDGRIGLKITGGLALAAFEFELMGMQVTVPQSVLDDPSKISEIGFALDGFGIEIQKGTLSVMGAFLRQHREERNKDGSLLAYDEFSGIVQVAFPPLNLTGMGSYAMYQGHPSLFLFVALGYPIPVHPSLLIEGMALGFGIHRDFIPPKLDEVLTYPLVAVSVTPPPPIDIQQMAEAMHQYFPPAVDCYFVVAGVKFKAFGLVDSIVMVAVKFGRSLEIDLFGVSSILFPAAFIELEWTARFVPESGSLFIGGQLTERSYLLVPQVQLTGGFAVAAWLAGEYKGDFVVSVGGYHPNFHAPDHYPNHVPRLGISFHLGPADIKGGMYFAITPQCVMMGGALEVSVKQDSLSAFIKLSLDAIIFFEPFHYDVLITADAGVKVDLPLALTTLHLDMHLHVDVHIWGPEFSGTASLDVGPKTFDVAIGAAAEVRALPLTYEKFKEKFLPTVCTVSVTQGLLRKATRGGVEIHVVDARKVIIEARSAVPVTKGDDARLGITPMDVRGAGFSTTFTLGGHDNFNRDEIRDSVPAGIWGGAGLQAPDLTDPASGLLRGVLTGYRLTPAAERESSPSHAIQKEKLAYNTDRYTLQEQEVTFQMAEDGDTSVFESPVNSYGAYTGLDVADLRQVDLNDIQQTQLLRYALR